MIREGSMVRVVEGGRLGFISDLEEDVHGNKDDPACVRTVRLFDPALPLLKMPEEDHFIAELAEVTEAHPDEQLEIVQDFEFLIVSNSWADDCPPDGHIAIWVVMEEDRSFSVWQHRGWTYQPELLGRGSPSKRRDLLQALLDSNVPSWKRSYRGADDWQIGGNLWSIEAICGSRSFYTGGFDGYPEMLKDLCRKMRHFGIPVKFEAGEGLVYYPIRKKKRKG